MHNPCRIAGLAAMLTFCATALAADSATQPAAPPATRPAPLDPSVEKILDRLEARKISDVEAGIRFVKVDTVLDSKQVYEGIIRFRQEEPNPRFFIQFDRSDVDGIVKKEKEWHVFDGEKYLEAREATRTIIPHQVVEPGKKTQVFRLGEGPFPLPFGQKKSEITRHFAVKLVPPAADDPKNTDHLECTPLPGTDMDRKYGTVHFWIDRELDLPVKVATVEKEEGNTVSATFMKPKIDTGMAASQLNLPAEVKREYKVAEQ